MGSKRTTINLAVLMSAFCLAGCKKPPEEMTAKEVYEEYYESICIDLGYKVWSKKMQGCIAKQIHETHKLGE